MRSIVHHSMLFLSLLALALVAPRAGAQAPATGGALEADAVLEAVRALDAALARKDTAAAGRWLAPGYRYFSSTGQVWARARFLEFLSAPAYRLDRARRSELEPLVDGAAAVVSSRWIGAGVYGTESFDDDQRCSLVLVRQEEGWRLLAEHCTQIRPDA
ncbi:MAG TPA: nuclear transport factor 2 family protein [Gemmatimonadaceae bacterium]|jgi:hypothetical protein|nr:nuclear transport factor 2 family protein [Gemmatimonadaceae bacterium]